MHAAPTPAVAPAPARPRTAAAIRTGVVRVWHVCVPVPGDAIGVRLITPYASPSAPDAPVAPAGPAPPLPVAPLGPAGPAGPAGPRGPTRYFAGVWIGRRGRVILSFPRSRERRSRR